MDLKMFLGKDLIDTITINAALLDKPGYIESLKMEIEDKNDDIIELINETPNYCIDRVPSSMNHHRSDFN